MAIRAGPFPRTKSFERARAAHFGRLTESVAEKKGLVWHSSLGWVAPTEKTWDKRVAKVDEIEVKLSNGMYAYVPADRSGLSRGKGALSEEDAAEMMKSVNAAFGEGAPIRSTTEIEPFDGHIRHIEYSKTNQMMKVDFQKSTWDYGRGRDATVVYARVPAEVYEQLYATGAMHKTAIGADGNERNLLGIVFWNLVRTRGTRTAGKYEYHKISGEGPAMGRTEGTGGTGGGGGLTPKEQEGKSFIERLLAGNYEDDRGERQRLSDSELRSLKAELKKHASVMDKLTVVGNVRGLSKWTREEAELLAQEIDDEE